MEDKGKKYILKTYNNHYQKVVSLHLRTLFNGEKINVKRINVLLMWQMK